MTPLLKICGMKIPQNIMEVATLAPDLMGYIFYAGSSRCVGENFRIPEKARAITSVGVFVDQSIEFIKTKVEQCGLSLVQLHGNESPDTCELLRKHVKVIKAIGVETIEDVEKTNVYKDSCDYFLFDTKTMQFGGSGKMFDHDLLEAYELSKPYFLSGGIGAKEANYYLSTILDPRLYAIDVNSRFESSPGIKNCTELKMIAHLKRK